jgi:hypothetical protein
MNHGEYDNRLDEEFLEDADSRPIAQRTLANNSLEGATSFCNALGVLPLLYRSALNLRRLVPDGDEKTFHGKSRMLARQRSFSIDGTASECPREAVITLNGCSEG